MILTVILDATLNKRYVVEDLRDGNLNRVKEFTYSAGGKGVNIAKVAAITGEKVMATGFLGGFTGDCIKKELEDSGVDTDFVRVSAENRICLHIYDEGSKTETEFVEPAGYVTNTDQEDLLTKYIKLVEKSSVVVISGNVPKGVDSSFYRLLIEIAKEKNKKVILNTKGSLLKDTIKTLPTMIKADIQDLIELSGKEDLTLEDAIDIAKGIQRTGVETLVLFNGEEAWAVCNNCVYETNIHTDKSINNMGCDEALVAGYAAGYSRGLSLEDTVKYANAISSARSQHIKTGLFLLRDMDELLRKMELRQISG